MQSHNTASEIHSKMHSTRQTASLDAEASDRREHSRAPGVLAHIEDVTYNVLRKHQDE